MLETTQWPGNPTNNHVNVSVFKAGINMSVGQNITTRSCGC